MACLQVLLLTRFWPCALLFVLVMESSWVWAIIYLQRHRLISLIQNRKEKSMRLITFSKKKNNKSLIFIELKNTHNKTAKGLQNSIQPIKKHLSILWCCKNFIWLWLTQLLQSNVDLWLLPHSSSLEYCLFCLLLSHLASWNKIQNLGFLPFASEQSS